MTQNIFFINLYPKNHMLIKMLINVKRKSYSHDSTSCFYLKFLSCKY